MSIENVISLVVMGVVLVGLGWYGYVEYKDTKAELKRPPIILPPPIATKKQAAKKTPAKKAVKKAKPVAKYAAKKTSKK